MKPTTALAGALLLGGTLALSPASPAAAAGAAYSDPVGDSRYEGSDIVSHFLALNSTAVVSAVTYRAWDLPFLQSADIVAELDTNNDGGLDFLLLKPAGGQAAEVLDSGFAPVPGCTANASFDAGRRTVTLATAASCIGTPAGVRVSVYTLGDEDYDVAPDFDTFTFPPVPTDAPPPAPGIPGAIGDAYRALGGAGGFLGQPLTPSERGAAGGGAYLDFQGGAVYWSPGSGAHEVHGGIRDVWNVLGKESSVLGYPTSNEFSTGLRPGGRLNFFERGSVYWSPTTGAHEVYGALLAAWGSGGYESGALGFPVSGEYDWAGTRRSDFQGGTITWQAPGIITFYYN